MHRVPPKMRASVPSSVSSTFPPTPFTFSKHRRFRPSFFIQKCTPRVPPIFPATPLTFSKNHRYCPTFGIHFWIDTNWHSKTIFSLKCSTCFCILNRTCKKINLKIDRAPPLSLNISTQIETLASFNHHIPQKFKMLLKYCVAFVICFVYRHVCGGGAHFRFVQHLREYCDFLTKRWMNSFLARVIRQFLRFAFKKTVFKKNLNPPRSNSSGSNSSGDRRVKLIRPMHLLF